MNDLRFRTRYVFMALLISLACPIHTSAETFTYQGFLSNASGAPQLGSFDLTFRLYTASSGGDHLWQESHLGVTMVEGRFQVELGSLNPDELEEVVRSHADLWLGIAVGDSREMEPRQRLGSAPRALRARFADNVAIGTVTGEMIAEGSVGLDRLAPACETGQFLIMGVSGWECADESVCAPETEICDGIDNDCDGKVDEDLAGDRCDLQDGVCAGASRQCNGDQGFVACGPVQFGPSYESFEVSCDGLDNDCDGTPDDNLPKHACSKQVGVCAGSLRTCGGNSGWLSCGANEYGPNYQAVETTCDGLDNDCDGAIDEGFANLGDTCVVGAGSCSRSGLFVCNAEGSGVQCGVSAGEPKAELCDGLDNDCDGVADEDFALLGSACAVGVGTCQGTGSFQCAVDGSGTQCSASAGDPAPEICDGLDNDCDGEVDEDFVNLGNTCTVGAGSCTKSGLFVCNAEGSGIQCGVSAGEPNVELCDGLDNDCDGVADEDFANLGSACVVGVGICQTPGVFECMGDGTGTLCSAVAGVPESETCNGLDDDCDSEVDEGLPSQACPLSEGVCNGSTVQCGGVIGYPECNVLDYGPNYEIVEYSCDDRDNDCDGEIDEEFGLGESCGLGNCAGGSVVCAAEGGVTCSTQVNAKTEVCNGEDDDCDGIVDEGC